jgi:UDP-glucose 4-epimerase
MGRKLLITGALGHIGSKLIRSIQPGTFESVVLVDNLSTQRYCSLMDLPGGTKFQFFEEDVTTADLNRHVKGAEAVIHLAAVTNAEASVRIAPEVERVNYGGTERIAEACYRQGSPLIFLSTTSVYGSQSQVVDENCKRDELKPQSPYAESKLRAEEHLKTLGQTKGLRFVVCRFGTIFGWSVGMRFHTAINKFCWQAVMKQPVTVWKTALQQKRPYLDLGDGVRALHFLMDRKQYDQEIYNVVSVNSTVGDIIDVLRIHAPDLVVQFVDSPIMNQLSYHVANTKFEKLGFQFRGDLKQGISETLQHLRGVSG